MKTRSAESGRSRSLLQGIPSFLLVAFLAIACVPGARAATPPSGTLSPGNPSVSWTGSITGFGTGEATCVDGVSCDSFQVIVQPGDYTGKQLRIGISWTIPAYDYDLYVHLGTLHGAVFPATNGGPPTTSEQVLLSLEPGVLTSPVIYWAHVQAATVPAGQTYVGLAAIVPLPNAISVTHLAGSLPFSHTVPLYAVGTVRDLEPSIRVDVRGNCYVGGIRGVPAGVDMWRLDLNPNSPDFDPEMKHATYLGQPDVFHQTGAEDSTAGGADGGGDIDFAPSFPTDPDSTPVLTMVSLAVANISSSYSTDRGATWVHQAAAADIPSDDRQWIETDGPNTVYLFYRAAVPLSALYVQKSTDHGLTYGPAVAVLVNNDLLDTTPGYIDVDHASGAVYVAHQNKTALYVSHSTDGGATWTSVLVDDQTSHGHLFDVVKVGDDGTVYAAWSNERHILYAFSTDQGNTWSSPGIVDNPDSSQTNVFPWIEAGSAGRVDIVWFGTKSPNTNVAEWDLYFSQSLNANSATPTFRQQIVSDHRVHALNISEGGLGGNGNRNLGDYFQVAYDPQGAAVISFGDDHNDFDGNTFVVRQLAGTGLLASANGNGTVQPVGVSPITIWDPTLPEVTDPLHDAVAQVQPVPTDNPFDVVSIKYTYDNDGPNGPYLGARMKLSGLITAPPGTWRIAFTANAPDGDAQPPFGVSDHGDMFYLIATDTSATPQFRYGTAYRDSAPLVPQLGVYGMAYNPAAGVADSGVIDTITGAIRIKLAVSKINALIPAGHDLIGEGSWLSGLRGNAGSTGSGPRDQTRGGRFNFYVTLTPAVGVDPALGPARLSLVAAPNPARGPAALRFDLPVRGKATLAIYDVQGRIVHAVTTDVLEAGPHIARWDGRTTAGEPAAGGVYFAKLTSGGRDAVSRFVLLR